MKVTWEKEDIKMGRKFSRKGISEIWIIGWSTDNSHISSPNNLHTISLDDGMVLNYKSKLELAEMLTKEEYLPVELISEE